VSEIVDEIARALTDSAAESIGQRLSERALLRPDPGDEAQAWTILKDLVEKENRKRVFEQGGSSLSSGEQESIKTQIYDGLFRLGPLQHHIDDPEVEEVICNGASTGFVIRSGGRKEEIDTGIADDDELRALMVRAAARVGRRLDEASPSVDVHLPSGRLHAVIPPLVPQPCLTIRVQRLAAESLADLVSLGTLPDEAARFLAAAVAGGLNVLVSGGTGSGKTTTLHALGREIPEWERLVTIEETPELQLDEVLKDCVALTARFANMEGLGSIKIRDLVRLSLRMRPSRIIVGEVRGEEALDMLSAMNTGHDGSACSLHANSARKALTKLRIYTLMAEEGLGPQVANEIIAETINLVVHLRSDHRSGRRVVESIVEVDGIAEGRVLTSEIFRSEAGELRWTGLRPKCAGRLEERGFTLPWAALEKVG
jgi:pilus assembly protein CpaF